jgi:hypothetical protein
MKKLFLSICLVVSLNGISQTNSDNDKVIDVIKNSRVDTIVNFYTPKFADHSKYKGKMLDVLYSKNFNLIISMIKTNGFISLTHLYPNNIVKYTPLVADTSFINLFNTVTSNLPKNKSKVETKLSSCNISNDKLLFEEYTFEKNNKTYFVRFLFRNSQLEGIFIQND